MSMKDKILAQHGENLKESSGAAPADGVIAPAKGPAAKPAKMVGVERSKDVARIELARIVPDPDQPRKEFAEGEMAEMVESLRANGQLQPIRVRWADDLGKYMVIMGERRYRGAVLAGLESLSAVIHEGPLSSAEILEIQLIENTVRANLKPIELAHAIRRLIDEFGYTQAEVAGKLRMKQPAVSASLALLNLTPEIQAKVDGGKISPRTGLHIARANSPQAQLEIAEQVERGNLTEAETAEVVKKTKTKAPRATPAKGRGRGGSKAAKPEPFTEKVFNESPFRFTVFNRKGIETPALLEAIDRLKARLSAAS